MDEAEARAIASRLEEGVRRVGTAERARRQTAYLRREFEFARATRPEIRATARRA